MYRFFFIIFLAVICSSSLLAMDQKAIDDILAKIEKASDPEGISKDIKTSQVKSEISIPEQKIKFKVTITDKYPDKTISVTQIPGLMKVKTVFNGKEAWEESSTMGIRSLTGKELNNLKFHLLARNPKTTLKDVYSKIEISDKLEKVGDYECYKLTCYPDKSYGLKPTIEYYDNKLFLLRKSITTEITQMGEVQAVIYSEKYKKMHKMMMSMEATIEQMKMKMKAKILDFKIDIPVDDSLFQKKSNEKKVQNENTKK